MTVAHPTSGLLRLSPAQWVAAIGLLWLAVNAVWLQLDTRAPAWDESFYAAMALKAAQAMARHDFAQAIREVLINPLYPPLGYFVCAPAAWIQPHVDVLILWMNAAFGVLLVTSLWGLARELGVPWVGVGATLLTLYQAPTTVIARAFMMDFPLAAIVTWAYWRILTCERQWTSRNGIILGLAIGLGLLTKLSFAVYLIPAMVWLAFRRMRGGNLRADWRPAVAIGLVAISVSGWWYLWSGPQLIEQRIAEIFRRALILEHMPTLWLADNWSLYILMYAQRFGTIVPCAGLVCAAGLILWRRARTIQSMLLWLLASYVLLSLFPNKDERYLLPLVPLAAFVTWWGLLQIPWRHLRRAVTVALACWCLAQWAVVSSARVDQLLGPWQEFYGKEGISLFRRSGFLGLPAVPMMADGVTETAIARLAAHMSSRPSAVLMLVDDMYHNANTLRYEASRQNVELYFTAVDGVMTEGELRTLWDQPYDFVLYREPSYPHFPYFKDNVRWLSRVLHGSLDRYQRVEELIIPSGGVLEIYKNRARGPHSRAEG